MNITPDRLADCDECWAYHFEDECPACDDPWSTARWTVFLQDDRDPGDVNGIEELDVVTLIGQQLTSKMVQVIIDQDYVEHLSILSIQRRR